MGKSIYVYVVREFPHPRYPRDTIMFSSGVYELPNGERRNAVTDALVATVNPPTNRQGSVIAAVPSYR